MIPSHSYWRFFTFVAFLTLLILVTSCSPSHPQSTFDAVGPVARSQLHLFYVVFWAAVVVFVVVVGLLLYSVVRFRERPGQPPPKQIHGHRNLEIAWTLAPILILTVIAVMTIQTIFELENPPQDELVSVTDRLEEVREELQRVSDDSDRDALQKSIIDLETLRNTILSSVNTPLRLKVVAHQWWWEIIYLDYNITSANEIRVPVDRDVSIDLVSLDVIHSFWVPKLAGKKDIIPNNDNKTWFRAEETGTFQGQCAEFCGIAHALMKFSVIVETEKEFDQWIVSQQAVPSTPQTYLAQEGYGLFASKGCATCHTVSGPDLDSTREVRHQLFLNGVTTTHAPNLTHFATRETFAGGIMDNTQENLEEWLNNPEDVKPGNRMARLAQVYNNPELELTQSDISALVAYLQSLE